jgi:hypothetical protein
MKKTELALIVLIASISVLAAYFVTKAILGDEVTEPQTVKTIEVIKTSITPPSKDIFNTEAINPTVEVQITPGNQ